MKIQFQNYYVRLERVKTGTWLETYIRIWLPRQNHPEYRLKIRNSLESYVIGLYGRDWEMVTYSPEDAETPPRKYVL